MADDQALQGYSNSLNLLRKQCLDAGMSEDQFRRLYTETLKESQRNHLVNSPSRILFTKFKICLLIAVLILTLIALDIKHINSNLQEYIYPGLKFLRRISLPLISLFPSLTELSQETCLLQNPFFSVVDMDCWPCSSIVNVKVFEDPVFNIQQNTAPFVYKTDQKPTNTSDVKKMYENNRQIFDKEAPNVYINYKHYVAPQEMFDPQTISENNLFIWKFNTMNAARMLRQLVPRPKVVPKYGQSIERYIIIDNSKEPFRIPDTECGFSFVLALSGSREVVLKPAEECQHQCRSLAVHLKEKNLLWYNWWYWKPVVLPSQGNNSFVAHVGSYC